MQIVIVVVCTVISIHALLAESDSPKMKIPWAFLEFLSTLSLRRATILFVTDSTAQGISIHALLAESDNIVCHGLNRTRYFYPRSPCGERLNGFFDFPSSHDISIHALLAESDAFSTLSTSSTPSFLSTLSLRRATRLSPSRRPINDISIHALLAESDQSYTTRV